MDRISYIITYRHTYGQAYRMTYMQRARHTYIRQYSAYTQYHPAYGAYTCQTDPVHTPTEHHGTALRCSLPGGGPLAFTHTHCGAHPTCAVPPTALPGVIHAHATRLARTPTGVPSLPEPCLLLLCPPAPRHGRGAPTHTHCGAHLACALSATCLPGGLHARPRGLHARPLWCPACLRPVC